MPFGAANATPEALLRQLRACRDHRERARVLQEARGGWSAKLERILLEEAGSTLRADPEAARSWAECAHRVASTLGGRESKVLATRHLAEAHTLLGRFDLALDAADRGLEECAAVTTEDLTEIFDLTRIQALGNLDRCDEARTLGAVALDRAAGRDDARGQVGLCLALAQVAFRQDDARGALQYYARAEANIPGTPPNRLRALLDANRGTALAMRNRFRASRRHLERAQALYKGEGLTHSAAAVTYNAGYVAFLRGAYREALACYAESRPVFERVGDQHHLAQIHLDSAETYLHLAMPADAAREAQQAEATFHELALKKETAQAVFLQGRAHEIEGRLDDARAAYIRAEKLFATLRLGARRAACMIQRARLCLHAGDTEAANGVLDTAGVAATEVDDAVVRLLLAYMRARVALATAEPARARDLVTRAMAEARHVRRPWVALEGHRLLGSAYAQLGERLFAIDHFSRAIGVLEQTRLGVPPDEYMTAFLGGHAGLYEAVVRLLADEDDVERAFGFAERAKSRALVDLLVGHASSGDRRDPRLGAGGRRVHYLRERLAAIYRRLARSDRPGRHRDSPQSYSDEARTLEAELARHLRSAVLEGEPGLGVLSPTEVRLSDLQAALPDGTAFLQYFVAEKSVQIFVVTRDAIVTTQQVIERSVLRFLVGRFHFHLTKQEQSDEEHNTLLLRATRSNLAQLSRTLIDPILAHLDVPRLVIAAHDGLHQLPFHALPLGATWLADRFEISYAPSAAVYLQCRARAEDVERQAAVNGGTPVVLGVADERAPQIRAEVAAVAASLPEARTLRGGDATIAAWEQALQAAPVVHLATHGTFHNEQPLLSRVRLGDGWLTAYELYQLRMHASLVVLSTCESGVAAVSDGGEILGLVRGLLYAGAPAYLTGQWRVHDDAARQFMTRFYEVLGRSGGSVHGAYDAALRAVRADREHPYFWAPFFLGGHPPRHVLGNPREAQV